MRIISFTAAALISVCVLALCSFDKNAGYKRAVENVYAMCINELDGSLESINIALSKAVYATTATQLSSLAVEIGTESTVAKNALSQLPYSGDLGTVNKFLSQAGDYTYYLSKKVISGGVVEDSERDNIKTLSAVAKNVSDSVNILRTEYERIGSWNETMAETLDSSADESESYGLDNLEKLLADYPTLLYDGPFSDHMLNAKPKLLEGAAEISEDEALKIAGSFIGSGDGSVKMTGETGGNLPCYNFAAENSSISISKLGGSVVYMKKYRPHGIQTVSYDKAKEIAEEYVAKLTDVSFAPTYYFTDEGICTVSLAALEGAAVCYADLIKVGVSLDNGEVISLETAGFISNHTNRTVPAPKYTADEAAKILSDDLSVLSIKRAVIPTSGGNEKHCYEFCCEGNDGEELLVYINVMTLEEEEIMLLLRTDGGTLTK